MTDAIPASNTLIRRADGLMAAALGDELLMMSVAQGRYFNLNGVGARIWELLAEPTSVDAVVATLVAEYEVEPPTARREVEAFLAALRDRDLLAPVDGPSA